MRSSQRSWLVALGLAKGDQQRAQVQELLDYFAKAAQAPAR